MGPSRSVSSVAQNNMVYCRPKLSWPQLSLDRPTQAWRPNKRPPWLDVPVSVAKPDSSANSVLVPPPRSSVPRRPQRDGTVPLRLGMRTTLLPAVPMWLTYSTPVSTTPYRVTDWALANAGTASQSESASGRSFMMRLLLVVF